MRVEHVVVAAPLIPGGANEDSYVVRDGKNGRPFFGAVIDAHGTDYDDNGQSRKRSHRVAEFGKMISLWMYAEFMTVRVPAHFPAVFEAASLKALSQYGPSTYPPQPRKPVYVGAVASCVSVFDGSVHLAYVGDCRLYRHAPNSTTGYELLSRDHTADNPREMERLQPILQMEEGIRLVESPLIAQGCTNVRVPLVLTKWDARQRRHYGWLEPTRSFGDWEFHPAVTTDPEISAFPFALDRPEIYAVCSDGASYAVEAVFQTFKNHADLPLDQLKVASVSYLSRRADDATIVFFKVIP